MSFDRRAMTAITRLLAALGLLAHHEGRYQLTDTSRLYFLRESPFYWGHMLGTGQPQHARFRDALLGRSPEGRPGAAPHTPSNTGGSIDSWATGNVDLERARRVAAAMQSHSLAAAVALARNADFSGVTRLLDVGGGSGCFAIALSQRNPHLRCDVMELQTMCEVAQEYIRDGGVEDRVGTVAVDMFREPWPKGYDAMFFSNVFHDWNFDTCAWLAKQAYDALPPGSRICLHEMLLDDTGNGRLTAASFSVLMLGTQGQQFTFGELKGLLESAGFTRIEAQRTSVYYSLVTGFRA
jgi:acetylserotonin N-methyltransferase